MTRTAAEKRNAAAVRQRMFAAGKPFCSVGEAADWIAGEGWVMWYGRPRHHRWMINLPLAVLNILVEHKRIVRAKRIRNDG